MGCQIRKHVPDYYDEIIVFTELCPLKPPVLGTPYAGFVMNLNVITRTHRDNKDIKGCAVLVLGDFDGGELCFAELGVVFELKNGDLIVFPSGKITHFNLHYNGVRVSFVLHSDKSGEGYEGDFNGWDHVHH